MKQPVHVRNIQIGDGVPKICIPIVENTSDSILTAAKNVLMACPDIIEWRCDHFDQAEDPEGSPRSPGRHSGPFYLPHGEGGRSKKHLPRFLPAVKLPGGRERPCRPDRC